MGKKNKRSHKLVLGVLAGACLWSGCETVEDLMDLAPAVDAGSTGDDGGDFSGGDNAPADMDSSMPAPEKDAGSKLPEMDAGPLPDVIKGSDCIHTFVYDPAEQGEATTVVLAGASPFEWADTAAKGALPLHKDSDGKWRISVKMNTSSVQYKFVADGVANDPSKARWMADKGNCHDANDGQGGRNSVLFACQTPPACGSVDPDSGMPQVDASDPTPDAGTETDYSFGTACIETFEVDPANYPEITNITSVQMAGESPLDWNTANTVSLTKDDDGKWRATAAINKTSFAYKIVINGTEWKRDAAYCASVDDGQGGRNSVRYTCLAAAPACSCDLEVTWDPVAAGCGDAIASASFAGEPNGWSKSAMTKGQDGKFRITVAAAAGRVQYKIVIPEGDGDKWLSPTSTECGGDANGMIDACVPAQ